MSMIYYRGLNCHLACAINLADAVGVNYRDAFGTLWSETDFADDPKYHIYLSRRVFPNLEALGVKMDVLRCSSNKEAEESYSIIPEEELFIVGMDTFYIPWNPGYQHFHGPHYFFARKETTASLCCFDPTYNRENTRLISGDIVPHAFDFSRIRKLAVSPPRFSVGQEAREILRSHPETQEKLCAEIHSCKNREPKDITPLIKQINAMINNRHLFRRFLHQPSSACGDGWRFFDKKFFSKWEAVKNGLYKASIMKANESVVEEARGLFLDLMREETDMAKEMVMTKSDPG